MSTLRNRAAGLLCAAAMALPAARAAEPATPPAPAYRINDILQDTQKMSPATDVVDLVWWMPAEFWVAATADQPMSAKEKSELVQLFRDNTVVAVVAGEVSMMGVTKFRTEAELRSQVRLVDAAGHEYAPVPAADIDKGLAMMVQVLRPMLAGVIGEMGNNLNFYVFPGKGKDGKRIADPHAEGKFTVKLGETEYAYRLPLGSVMPPRFDATTGERFPGNYRFSPFSGAPLQLQAPAGSQ
jgi:hypothetical protein